MDVAPKQAESQGAAGTDGGGQKCAKAQESGRGGRRVTALSSAPPSAPPSGAGSPRAAVLPRAPAEDKWSRHVYES